MKKMAVLLCSMLVCMSALAGNPLKVTSSKVNLKDFMKKNATATLVLDWKNTTYDEKKSPLDEFSATDYEFIKKDCTEKFIEGFNDKSKGLKLGQGDKGDYQFMITVKNIDSFINVMGWGSRTESKMWGTLKIVDASGDTIAEINIDEAEDGTDYVRREAFGKTFLLLGERIAKLK